MKTKIHILFFPLILPVFLQAQQKTVHTNMIWAGYYNTIRFNKKWSIGSDAQLRIRDWTDQWSQLLVRSGLNYSFNNHFTVTAGFAFFKNAQYQGKQLLLKNEWRPWQELAYQLTFHKTNFVQRLRTEQRFLQLVENGKKSNHYEYVFRLRYRVSLRFPLQNDKLKLLIGNEVLVNPGYNNSQRFFDQNRSFAGINIKLNSKTNFECQYLKIYQWRSNTSVLDDQNVFRVNMIQQFNLKKSHDAK